MDDIARAMELGGVNDTLDKSAETILKNNISWHLLYPAPTRRHGNSMERYGR